MLQAYAMNHSTHNLILAPDAAIDLQLHTTLSDGAWQPAALLDYLVSQQFGVVAITDHDRPDTANEIQQLACAKAMPVIVATEMSARWHGQMVDVLCFCFERASCPLRDLGRDVAQRQAENSRHAYSFLCERGYLVENPYDCAAIMACPSAQQPHMLVSLLRQHNSNLDRSTFNTIIRESGCDFATTPIDQVIDAAHRSGSICVLAHPGRADGFVCFDTQLLDELRHEVTLDGIEVYYPKHSAAQTAMFLNYAQHHGLLVSAGSDSHDPSKPPIKYQANLCRDLLERLGIAIQ